MTDRTNQQGDFTTRYITRPGEAQAAVAAQLRTGGWSLETAHAHGSTRDGYIVTGTVSDGPKTASFTAHVYPDGWIDQLRIDHHEGRTAKPQPVDPFEGIAAD